MAPVLKTGEVRASVGSNPTPSVQTIRQNPFVPRVSAPRLMLSVALVVPGLALLRLVFRVQKTQLLALFQLFALFTDVG